MITLTANAKLKLKEVVEAEGSMVRVSIVGGGCSGFNYAFSVKEDDIEGDIVLEDVVIVDPMSMMYLDGATLDYKVGLGGEAFVFENPLAKSTCGCGSSFSV